MSTINFRKEWFDRENLVDTEGALHDKGGIFYRLLLGHFNDHLIMDTPHNYGFRLFVYFLIWGIRVHCCLFRFVQRALHQTHDIAPAFSLEIVHNVVMLC